MAKGRNATLICLLLLQPCSAGQHCTTMVSLAAGSGQLLLAYAAQAWEFESECGEDGRI